MMLEDDIDIPKFLTNWTTDYFDNLDTSEYPFPNTLWHVKPLQEIILKSSAMLIVGILGIFLNAVILIILIRNKWLWTASNFLIGNLALIDLVTLIFCPWFMLVREFYQNYVLKNFGCRFEGFLQACCLLASVIAVMLVSYDRLASAVLTPEARVTKNAAPKLIIATWVVAIGLSLPWIIKDSICAQMRINLQPMYIQPDTVLLLHDGCNYYLLLHDGCNFTERQWLDYLEMFCAEDLEVLSIYWHFIVMLLVWIPLGVMILTYGTIMWRIEWTARELSSRGGGQTINKARGKAMRITAFILLAAALCRIPYTILVYWRNNLKKEINAVDGGYEIIWFLASYLMYVNCAINPLIYGFTNIRFRRAMDRTPGIACFRFSAWCCICTTVVKKKQSIQPNNVEKIFVIETSPRPKRKISGMVKNFLHINRQSVELSFPKVDEATTKPTKVTPLKIEPV